MPSPVGPEVLALLVPEMPQQHPLVRRALELLPSLSGTARRDVLTSLLAGPFAQGPLPEPVVVALAGEATDVSESSRRFPSDGPAQARLIDAMGRFDDTSVPPVLADAAWGTTWPDVRAVLLTHPQVPQEQKAAWLADVDVASLGALLRPGRDPASLELVMAEVERRAPSDTTFNPERAAAPAVPEELLSNAKVDKAAVSRLAALLPREPKDRSDRSDYGQRLMNRWTATLAWIGRTQSHVWDAVDGGDLLWAGLRRGTDLTSEEEERLLHLMDVHFAWTSNKAGVLDVLENGALTRTVEAVASRALVGHREATWWSELPEEFDPAADGGAVGYEAFEQWVAVRGHDDAYDERTEEQRAASRAWLREMFEERLTRKSPAMLAEDARGTTRRTLRDVLPVLTGLPQPTRPVPGSGGVVGGYGHEHLGERGWVASEEVRSLLRERVRSVVGETVLPYPPGPEAYGMEDWARLAVAALACSQDRAGVPADVLEGVRDAAVAWQRHGRGRHSDPRTREAVEALLKVVDPQPPPVRPKSVDEVTREVLDKLAADTSGPGGGPSTEAVDTALDEAVVTGSVEVDAVLARVAELVNPGAGHTQGIEPDAGSGPDLEGAVVRLAERLEQVVRGRGRPVTAQARSYAARAVLRSEHLSKAAVLALPAFAVFGAEASPGAWGRSPWDDRQVRLRMVLLELVDPTGEDPQAWDRLAGFDVANRGKDAWMSVRAVLQAAGIPT